MPADVLIAAIFGIFGYWLVKHDFEPSPLVLAFVLRPLMEANLRRAMLIARGAGGAAMIRKRRTRFSSNRLLFSR